MDLLSQTTLTVRYTVAIRQAPHPRLSFCAELAQIRRLLACDLLLVLCTASRASTSKNISFGARHINHNIKSETKRQEERYI